MLGPLDYVLWCLGVLAEIAVVVCVVRTKSFLRYYSLVFYILCDAIVTSGLCGHPVLLADVRRNGRQQIYWVGSRHHDRDHRDFFLCGGPSKPRQPDWPVRGRIGPESLFRGSCADLFVVGRDPAAARNAHALDSAGARAWNLFQR